MHEKSSLRDLKILVFQKSGFIGGAEKNLQRWVKYFNKKYNVLVTLCGPGKGTFFEEMALSGHEISIFDLPDWRKGKNFVKRYLVRSKILTFYKDKNSVDLIFSNDFFYAPYAVYLGKKLNIPVIVHIQSDLEPKRIYQYSLNHADGVIITTRSTYRKISPFFKPNVLQFIPYGVESPSKPISTESKFYFNQEKNLIFGVAANLLPHKGLDFIFELALCLKTVPGWEIHWVGGDSQNLLEKLRLRVKNLGLESKLIFHGFYENMDSFYKSIDCLIHPAQYEPFGIVLIEAMSHGIPIISTKTNGGIEILSDIDDGNWLVELNGVTQMAKKIEKLLNMRNELGLIGKKFEEKFKKEYFFSNSMNKMENFFSDVFFHFKNLRSRQERKVH